jgi:hypothetical protein
MEPAFDERLLITVHKEWEKEIGPVSIENIIKHTAAGFTKELIRHRLKEGRIPDEVFDKMFCEGHGIAMRWWFAMVFVQAYQPSASQATKPHDR